MEGAQKKMKMKNDWQNASLSAATTNSQPGNGNETGNGNRARNREGNASKIEETWELASKDFQSFGPEQKKKWQPLCS